MLIGHLLSDPRLLPVNLVNFAGLRENGKLLIC